MLLSHQAAGLFTALEEYVDAVPHEMAYELRAQVG
jgi:hypothetical protein